MTTTETPKTISLTWVGTFVDQRVREIQEGYRLDNPRAVATLARLRRGAGKEIGDTPDLWGSSSTTVSTLTPLPSKKKTWKSRRTPRTSPSPSTPSTNSHAATTACTNVAGDWVRQYADSCLQAKSTNRSANALCKSATPSRIKLSLRGCAKSSPCCAATPSPSTTGCSLTSSTSSAPPRSTTRPYCLGTRIPRLPAQDHPKP